MTTNTSPKFPLDGYVHETRDIEDRIDMKIDAIQDQIDQLKAQLAWTQRDKANVRRIRTQIRANEMWPPSEAALDILRLKYVDEE